MRRTWSAHTPMPRSVSWVNQVRAKQTPPNIVEDLVDLQRLGESHCLPNMEIALMIIIFFFFSRRGSELRIILSKYYLIIQDQFETLLLGIVSMLFYIY